MKIFNREHKPRIAFREQRNGVRHYFVETWFCCESGCFYSQNSETTKSLKKAEKMLKEISDREIVKRGIIN